MWQKMTPLVGGLCLTADFNQMWSKLCPLLEDFVMQQTLTKCGPNCAPCWRTLSRSRLQPNVVRNVPLLEDFVSLWTSTRCGPNMCPSSENFVTLQTLTKCGPNMCPSKGDFVLLRSSSTCGSTTRSSSNKAGTKQIGLRASNNAELKPPSPITLPYDQCTRRYPYQQASTKK
jgi:hypothetical protein